MEGEKLVGGERIERLQELPGCDGAGAIVGGPNQPLVKRGVIVHVGKLHHQTQDNQEDDQEPDFGKESGHAGYLREIAR